MSFSLTGYATDRLVSSEKIRQDARNWGWVARNLNGKMPKRKNQGKMVRRGHGEPCSTVQPAMSVESAPFVPQDNINYLSMGYKNIVGMKYTFFFFKKKTACYGLGNRIAPLIMGKVG